MALIIICIGFMICYSQNIFTLASTGNKNVYGESQSNNESNIKNSDSELLFNFKLNKKDTVIILDAGHGGFDGGAGVNGTFEKDINLKIVLFLNEYLTHNGYKTVLTRKDDKALNDESTKESSLRSKKVSDMKNRLNAMNIHKNSIFVSVHLNKYNASSVKGAQVFYSKNFKQSRILADNIQKSIVKNIQKNNKREIKKANKNIYLLHNATVPAVLVECGFLSNSEELALLKTEKYQKNMAFSVFCGIIELMEK